MTKVFISYSHDSDEHRDRILELSNRLRGDGIDCWIDQYEPTPPEGWPRKMDKGIREADFVLMVCTETYLKRLQLEEEEGKGLGVAWEGSLIYNTLYRDRTLNNKFIPVLFTSEDKSYIPTIIFGNSHYDLSMPRGHDHLYRHLRGELGETMPALGKKRFVRTIHSDALPTVEGELFGRKDELALLDQALLDADTHVVQFVASGGTGKTKLLRYWLDENHSKIEALIAWSFYSQGSGEDKQISATPFFMQALKSLGSDKGISDFNTEEEKGEHIADLLRERRCLLVLDGLEPLQQVGRGMRGELKDRAIRKLLRCLVGNHSSLCIITTRLPVHELKGRRRVLQHDLQNLAPEDGVALLRSFEVSGRDVDMLAAVEEYGRHALALHLLGNALATYLDGDVRKRDTLTELIGDYDDVERHAFKVMQAYEQWLEGTVELKLLYLLGLFDYPIEQEVLEVLWEAEIQGLTKGVKKKAWLLAQRDLISKYRMMSVYANQGGVFDCHPLIREYFGQQLKSNYSDIWKQAHTVLYEYYKELPKKYLPDTLEEMQPLFRAVAHGCSIDLHQQVLEEVYGPRIHRDIEEVHYLFHKLGAFSDGLANFSHFFTRTWDQPSERLGDYKALMLSWASFSLRGLGRLSDSVDTMRASINLFVAQGEWRHATIDANNLSEMQLTFGELQEALVSSSIGIGYSDKSENMFSQTIILATHADILHQLGRDLDSAKFFEKAQNIQKKWQPKHPLLYSFRGYKYCSFLISKNKTEEAYEHAKQVFKWANDSGRDILSEVFSQLIIGTVYSKNCEYKKAQSWLQEAMNGLQKSGQIQYFPLGLFEIASLHRFSLEFSDAYQSLREAYEIIEPSDMHLHLTDYHLEMARLILAVEADPAQYPEATPDREKRVLPFADQEELGILTLKGHINAADKLIEDTSYHRRDRELNELKTQASISC